MLRESCDTVRQRAFLEILYATGCRLSEVHGLDKADINLQNMRTLVIGKVIIKGRSIFQLEQCII
jgi:integrase/recombinase XerD